MGKRTTFAPGFVRSSSRVVQHGLRQRQGKRLRRACDAALESLERRTLLSGQAPVAANHTYTLLEDKPLVLPTGVTSLFFNSQPGDWVGQGMVKTWTDADGSFSASADTTGNHVAINFSGNGFPSSDWWYLDFDAAGTAALAPGYYGNATRYPFNATNANGLNVSGDGRGSNTLTGNFTVKQANFGAGGTVTGFSADFEQHSEGGTPALFGTINYHYVAPGSLSGALIGATDAEKDALTARVVTGPAHGTLTLNVDGSFTYVPANNYNGTDQFTWVANDGTSDSAPATVTLNITPVNDAPTFSVPLQTAVNEDAGAQTVAGFATAISPGPTADESTQTTAFTVSGNTNPKLFLVAPAIAANGTLTYTPAPDAYGQAQVTVVLKDNGGTANGGVDTSSSKSFVITINPVNDAPVAVDDVFNVGANQTLTISPAAPVTSLFFNSQAGDYIGGGAVRTWTTADGTFAFNGSPSSGVHGSFNGNGTTSSDWWYFDFTAGGSNILNLGTYTGATRYPFNATTEPGLSITGDGRGSNTLTGQFTVNQLKWDSSNKLLQFEADFEQHSEGKTPALFGSVKYNYVKQVGVLANDVDADGDPLTATLLTGPAHGTLTFNADGTLVYTPATGYVGDDSFTYKINDGQFDSNVATAVIHVTPGTPVPATGGPYSVSEGGTVKLNGSATSPMGLAITSYAWDFNYNGVTFNSTATGQTPTFSAAGLNGPSTRTIALRVTDSQGNVGLSTTTVSVLNVAPTLTASGAASAFTGTTYTLTLGATDPGVDTISSWKVNWGDGTTTTYTGNPTSVTHQYVTAGTYSIAPTATDEDGTYAAPVTTLTVTASPTLSGDGTLNIEGTELADTISVAVSGSLLQITQAGAVRTFALSSVRRVSVQARGGNDVVTFGAGTPGGTVDLGDGNDTLNAGSPITPTASMFVFGGNGNDTVAVGAAYTNLTYDGGAGSNTLTCTASGAAGVTLHSGLGWIVTGDPAAPTARADYYNVQTVRLTGGNGNDTFVIHGDPNAAAAPTAPVVIVAGGTGFNTLSLDTNSLVNIKRTVAGSTSGSYTFGDAAALSFSAIQQVVATAAPTITPALNFSSAGASAMSFSFSADVTGVGSASAFTVTEVSTGTAYTPSGYVYNAATRTATLTFNGGLPDGVYAVTLGAAGVHDSLGTALDGNGDGTAGDDFNFGFLKVTAPTGGAYLRLDDDGAHADLWLGGTAPTDGFAAAAAGPLQISLWDNNLFALAFGAGDDTLTVDFSNGNPLPVGGISLDAGAGHNTLRIIGTAGGDQVALTAAGMQFSSDGGSAVPLALANVQSLSFDGTAGGDDVINVAGGSWTVDATTVTDAPNVAVNVGAGAIATFTGAQHLAGLTVNGNAKLSTPTRSTFSLGALTLGVNGSFDIGDNLVFADNTTTSAASIAAALRQAYDLDAFSGMGLWDGVEGLTSSVAKQSAASNAPQITLGYIDGSIQDRYPGLDLGITLASNQILIRPALYGDLNLDGVVDGEDMGLIIQLGYFGKSFPTAEGWVTGDLNYDGFVDGDDIGLIIQTGTFHDGVTFGGPPPAVPDHAVAEHSVVAAAVPSFASVSVAGDATADMVAAPSAALTVAPVAVVEGSAAPADALPVTAVVSATTANAPQLRSLAQSNWVVHGAGTVRRLPHQATEVTGAAAVVPVPAVGRSTASSPHRRRRHIDDLLEA